MLVSNPSPGDIATVAALIRLVSDPNAAREWLDRIAKANDESQAILAEAQKLHEAAQDKLKIAEAARGDANTARSKAQELADATEARALELTKMNDAILTERARFTAATDKWEADAKRRAAELTAREQVVAQREMAADSNLKRAQNLVAEYEQKLAALKKLAE